MSNNPNYLCPFRDDWCHSRCAFYQDPTTVLSYNKRSNCSLAIVADILQGNKKDDLSELIEKLKK